VVGDVVFSQVSAGFGRVGLGSPCSLSAGPLFGVARLGCGAVFSPDTFSVFTIFGVCQGGKDALTNPKNR
jgi:hypothetical protein